ncbi:MAG: M56 family metallopeptidase [Stanieria sp.]
MHLMMILTALIIAWGLRCIELEPTGSWKQRWQRSLFSLIFPPLLLLSTSVAVICMGFQGQMLGIQASWLGYSLAIIFAIASVGLFLKLAYQGYQLRHQINQYEQKIIGQQPVRILETDFPYSAQIGFWHSELVISQGLLELLDQEHLAVVLAHEQAHVYYRDNFWFFWLGWLRYLTGWLPNSELLWQEILLLREVRADLKAAQEIDPLLLAESLIKIVKNPLESPAMFCANFSCNLLQGRLTERIDFILAEPEPISSFQWYSWSWMLLLFVPLFTIPLHY